VSTESVVIVEGARTPFGRFDGVMRDVDIPTLGMLAVRRALERAEMGPDLVDEVAIGVNFPGSDRSIARQIALASGIPEDRNAFTVDRACCSSMSAISLVSRGLRLAEIDVAVAGGAENMGRVPYFLESMRWGNRLGNVQLVDQLVISCPYTGVARAVQASNEALKYGVSRREQDEWALRSHQLLGEALARGDLSDEMFDLDIPADPARVRLERDESHRPGATLEKLQDLPTVYGSETVTAGNAPGLSAGAVALVLASGTVARERGWRTKGEILGYAKASGHPDNITSIPAVAARRALRNASVSLDAVDLIEVNEAFAAVPLVTTLELAEGDQSTASKLRVKTNVGGGAIAIGHPTGATGARLVLTLANALNRRGGGLGLVTICGGVGEAESIVISVRGDQ
jgi:acetyl-CoA C-acetyltransferase